MTTFLGTAWYLLERQPPTQATLRRAVSTAYYALFHLLTHEGCLNWAKPERRFDLARAFEHKQMLAASEKQKSRCRNSPDGSVGKHLFMVAFNFVQLQQKRESADYDFGFDLSLDQARLALGEAEAAFSSWEIVRNEPAAQDYLFWLLIRERPARVPEWGDR